MLDVDLGISRIRSVDGHRAFVRATLAGGGTSGATFAVNNLQQAGQSALHQAHFYAAGVPKARIVAGACVAKS